MFIHFVSRQGQNLLVNIEGITFVLQKGVFCWLYIRGFEVNAIVDEEFSAVYRKIKDISP